MGEAADLVRAAFERANAGDSEGLAALCDESVEFHDVTYHHGYSRQADAIEDLG